MSLKTYYKKMEEYILSDIFNIDASYWRQPSNSALDMIYYNDETVIASEFKSRNLNSNNVNDFFIEPSKITGIINLLKTHKFKKLELYFVVYCIYSKDVFVFDLYSIIKNRKFNETGNFIREKNHLSNNQTLVSNKCLTIDKSLAIYKKNYENENF